MWHWISELSIASRESELTLPAIPLGSFDEGMRCVWDGSTSPQDRILNGCGFACPSPWGPYGNYKAWKAQEDAGEQPGGSWKEALEEVHSCGAPTHCCCKPTCNTPELYNESFVGINWSDKYMRNRLDRHTQFRVLRDHGFYHIKMFSPDGLKEISEVYGTTQSDPDVPMSDREEAHAYVGIPNRYLSALSSSVDECKAYITKHILPYKDIVKMLIVGNEPLLCIKTENWAVNNECGSLQVPSKLVPAMKNVLEAAHDLGLNVPVSTAFNGGIMEMSSNPWTPCVAQFKPYVKPILEPVWDLLGSQSPPAPFIVNIYSWFAARAGHLTPSAGAGYWQEYQIDEKGEIVTTTTQNGEQVPVEFPVTFDGDYNYVFNYDMQVDMQRVAMCKNGLFNIPLWIGETGWPSGGEKLATYMNSKTYMQSTIRRANGHLLAPADVDTSRWTGVPHTVFLFEAFDEAYKFEIEHGNLFENDFGIFHEIGTPKWVDESGTLDLPLSD